MLNQGDARKRKAATGIAASKVALAGAMSPTQSAQGTGFAENDSRQRQ